MSKPQLVPLTLAATIHKTITEKGYPFSGLVQQDEIPIAFANGFINSAFTAGSIRVQLLSEVGHTKRGRPPDIEKKVGLGLAFQNYISTFPERGPLSKNKARERLKELFGYSSADAVKTALKRAFRDTARERRAIKHHFAWFDAQQECHATLESWSFVLQGTDLEGTFRGWLWQAPDGRARYGDWQISVTIHPTEEAQRAVAPLLRGDQIPAH